VGQRAITAILRDRSNTERGAIVIADLPRGNAVIPQEDGTPSLREGAVYTYAIDGVDGHVALEPSELFDPDDETGRRGRLRPGQSVGRLTIAVQTPDRTELRAQVDVAPAKLEQTREYRRMLEDIADQEAYS
jgi:hypothetical protein